MTAKTAAERQALKRQRRKEEGQVLVQLWVHKSLADKLKTYAKKISAKSA